MPIDPFTGIHYNSITAKTLISNKHNEKTIISSRKNSKSIQAEKR